MYQTIAYDDDRDDDYGFCGHLLIQSSIYVYDDDAVYYADYDRRRPILDYRDVHGDDDDGVAHVVASMDPSNHDRLESNHQQMMLIEEEVYSRIELSSQPVVVELFDDAAVDENFST